MKARFRLIGPILAAGTLLGWPGASGLHAQEQSPASELSILGRPEPTMLLAQRGRAHQRPQSSHMRSGHAHAARHSQRGHQRTSHRGVSRHRVAQVYQQARDPVEVSGVGVPV